MLKVPAEWEIGTPPADDERLLLVERIVASKRFRRAPQLRDILVYVVACSISQSTPSITEQEIGATVLGRGADFDPGHDNIVRAQMRHLRIKLGEYFENEGAGETLILTIPKGHYVAKFTHRVAARKVLSEAPAVEVREPDNGKPMIGRLGIGLVALLSTVIVVLLIAMHWSQEAAAGTPESYSFYTDILGPAGADSAPEVSLVLGNPVVLLLAGSSTANGEEIGAEGGIPLPPEWAGRLEPATNRADRVMPHHILQIKKHDYTGLGDATACFQLGQLMSILNRPTSVTQARFLSWDSAIRKPLIIVGSPHTNEWAHGNVPSHDFRIVKLGIEDRNPETSEKKLYRCVWNKDGVPVSDHGLIWAWQTPAGSRVLVLAGPSSAATGAMAARFANAEEFRKVYDRILADSQDGKFPANWQALFKIDIRDNLPVRTTYLTHRIYPSDS